MSGKEIPDPNLSAASSSWELRHQSAAADDDDGGDHSYFFGSDDYKDSSILNEFGWNIPPDSSCGASTCDGGFADLPPIEPDLAENRDDMMRSSSSSSTIVPMVAASMSSSSSEDQPEKSTASGAANPPVDTAGKMTNKKKGGEKRIRQPRFAFVTKSEVDHLEDGYRWRKYGQKAVKNSPFPRSYFRCTNSKCTVKKRIERSSEDPSVVITTYEGQHCHHSVGFPIPMRGTDQLPAAAPLFPRFMTTTTSTPNSNINDHDHLIIYPHHPPTLPHPPPPTLGPRLRHLRAREPVETPTTSASPPPCQGLLGDIVRNNG